MEKIKNSMVPELNPRIMRIEDLLESQIPVRLNSLTNKKRLLTPHPRVNPIRLDRVLNMSPDELLRANQEDPMTCWLIDKYDEQQILNRLVVLARGNHRGATLLFTSSIVLPVAGIAQITAEGRLLNYAGKFEPERPLYPFNVFLADVRACLTKY